VSLLSPRREVGEFRRRYKWMALVATLAFAVLFVRAVQLQIVQHETWARIAEDNVTKTIGLPATRGILRDAKGRIIATNRPSYKLFVTPSQLGDGDLRRLAELLSLGPREVQALAAKLQRVPERRRSHQIEVLRDLTRDQLAALEQHAAELPGVDVVAVPVRSYPYGSLGAHAIGYLNEVSAEDLERHAGEGYRAGDVIGRSGIERAWESYLRGRRGYRRIVVDRRLRRGAEAHAAPPETRREPIPGRDLTLTLDMDLMRIVERAFRGHPSGGVVVVDVRSGRVRALYSKPGYDLNEMAGRLTEERAREILENPLRPLIDKTIYESYFPGSTFKVISALAALGDGIVDLSYTVECPGYYEYGGRRFRCLQQHGAKVDMRRAIVASCNTYFYDIARQVGMDRLARYAHDFGLGERTGIGINTETAGFIPTVAWYQERYPHGFRGGFTLNEAIGQGNTKVTLMQLAMVYAALANGGTLYVPQLVERVSAPDGTVVEELQPRVRRRVSVSRAHLAAVVDGLYGVVNDASGTANDARIPGGVPVAGKTGTAQVSGRTVHDNEGRTLWYYNRSHAWFAGFAPANDPQLAIVVLVEHGGGGGRTAAPIGVHVLQEYLGPTYLAPQPARTAESGAAGASERTFRAATRGARAGGH
jgi:penicillin-binding protein 2